MPGMTPITVIKRDVKGEEALRYTGVILHRKPGLVILEAHFNRSDLPFMGTTLGYGDRFIETYFSDRWYNIFEIHDREPDQIKGWYCNVGRPAVFEADDRLSYIDLALDLWVAPDGSQTVLARDEFDALELDGGTRRQAEAGLMELIKLFADHKKPGLDEGPGFCLIDENNAGQPGLNDE